jgi:hypothetical protein
VGVINVDAVLHNGTFPVPMNPASTRRAGSQQMETAAFGYLRARSF